MRLKFDTVLIDTGCMQTNINLRLALPRKEGGKLLKTIVSLTGTNISYDVQGILTLISVLQACTAWFVNVP